MISPRRTVEVSLTKRLRAAEVFAIISPARRLRPMTQILLVAGTGQHFGGTQALRQADFTVRRGEIHALLGANGAGKSTLIKILAGVHDADGWHDPRQRLATRPDRCPRRISFVHQDLGLIESMSVARTCMGYGYPRRWKSSTGDRSTAQRRRRLNSSIRRCRSDRPVSELSRAEKSIVAIARALTGKAELLVLDEPTASLPEADVGRLFKILKRLRAGNVSVIYVTHRLDECFASPMR